MSSGKSFWRLAKTIPMIYCAKIHRTCLFLKSSRTTANIQSQSRVRRSFITTTGRDRNPRTRASLLSAPWGAGRACALGCTTRRRPRESNGGDGCNARNAKAKAVADGMLAKPKQVSAVLKVSREGMVSDKIKEHLTAFATSLVDDFNPALSISTNQWYIFGFQEGYCSGLRRTNILR